MQAALGHGEFQAVEALIAAGAHIDLPVAAATGRTEAVEAGLAAASEDERHRALALATQHGREEATRILLQAGEDPNRYNPEGCHSHSTPLHQAALAGHETIVRLLLDAGARTDIPDIHHGAPAAGWARHGGHTALAELIEAAKQG